MAYKKYNLVPRQCLNCKSEFKVEQRKLKEGRGKFCSLSCSTSYNKRGVRGLRGPLNYNWKGGRTRHSRGYILQHKPDHPNAHNGYVLEHRLEMESQLGRILSTDEIVHHKDGVKDNNASSNLEVMTPREHAITHAHRRLDVHTTRTDYLEGIPIDDIARKHGVHKSTIRRALIDEGLITPTPINRVDLAQVQELRAQGKSVIEIADDMGVSFSAVYRAAKKKNVNVKLKHGEKERPAYRKSTLVELKCPNCGVIFIKRKNLTHLIQTKRKATFCSRACSGKFIRNYREPITSEVKKAIDDNVIRVFKE